MRRSNDIFRVGLASASLATVGYPVISGIISGSLLMSYLLPNETKNQDEIDSLTGLLNLESFKKALNEAILKEIHAPLNKKKLYVTTLDVLGFSEINKKKGYSEGRRVLKHVARVIKQQSTCIEAARIYGDVFLLSFYSDSIFEVKQDLLSIIQQVENLNSNDENIDICCGISELQIANEEGSEVDIVSSSITQAEVARLIGKRNADKINCYKTEYASEHLDKIKMEDALLKSIDNNEISIFFQPKVSTTDYKIMGFEALCRWYHKELGFISPVFFIPLAEETGFIHKLGMHVIDESCKTLHWLNEQGYTDKSVAINVSIAQLEYLEGKPLISHLRDTIEKYNINPLFIEIEITESMAAKDFNLIKKHVETLRKLGVTVSLDDFGTGESTLFRLKELSLHQLKIDKTFVDDIYTQRGKDIMEGIFTIARAMNLTTVAEGVETQEQAEILEKMGCSYLQGYHLGKPMPKDYIVEAIEANCAS